MDEEALKFCLDASEQTAKRLLVALEDARTRVRSKTKLGEADVKRQALMLLERFHFYNVGPPKVVLQLIANCMNVKAAPYVIHHRNIPTKNYEAWDMAARFEAEQKPDPTGKRPSLASENAVAHAAFPSDEKVNPRRKEIKKWRETQEYLFEVGAFRLFIKERTQNDG